MDAVEECGFTASVFEECAGTSFCTANGWGIRYISIDVIRLIYFSSIWHSKSPISFFDPHSFPTVP